MKNLPFEIQTDNYSFSAQQKYYFSPSIRTSVCKIAGTLLSLSMSEFLNSMHPLGLRHCRCSLFVEPFPQPLWTSSTTILHVLGVSQREGSPRSVGTISMTSPSWYGGGNEAAIEGYRLCAKGGRDRGWGVVSRGCRVILGMVTGWMTDLDSKSGVCNVWNHP